ncbi:hypothetical protein [Methylosarcina fibrata]|uniref:hypothetical protein n=1 Tax=Methylosarcina fibrata TaxID=105972 RepID=UPI0003A82BBF|nr:hypothetical protein [Methylosarcina fibrata]
MSIKTRLIKLETQKRSSGSIADRLEEALARGRARNGSKPEPLHTREELEADLAKYPPDSMEARVTRSLLRVCSGCYE